MGEVGAEGAVGAGVVEAEGVAGGGGGGGGKEEAGVAAEAVVVG